MPASRIIFICLISLSLALMNPAAGEELGRRVVAALD
jgi:hypothetical protein